MSDLVFATRGQAEMLAAQEAVRKKALDTKQEFEEAAKATGAWDAATMKLKSSAETALRSISTEQEKIAEKIAKIQAAQEKGLVPPKEAEEGIQRLRQQWIDVDEATLEATEATLKAKEATEAQARANLQLKSNAESALRSIQTEEERILEQIDEIEAAMSKGLVPPSEAEEGLQRLRERLKGLGDEAGGASSNVLGELKKAFSPMQVIKVGLSFVGVKAGIEAIKTELKAMQDAVDERAAEYLKPKEKSEELADELEKAQKEAADAKKQLGDAQLRFSQAKQSNLQSENELQLRRRSELRDVDRDLALANEDAATEEAERRKQLAAAIKERDRHVRQQEQRKSEREGLGSYDNPPEEDVALERMNQQIAELQAKGMSTALRRRIDELKQRQLDIALDNSVVDPAALNEASQEVVNRQRAAAEAERKVREVADRQRAFINSPEGINLRRELDLRQIAEKGFSEIVQGQKSDAISSEVIDEINKGLRAGGSSELGMKTADFIDRWKNDGLISESERINRLRNFAADLADGEQDQLGKNDFEAGTLGRAATAEELRLAAIFERMADRMERREEDAARERRKTNELLEKIAGKESLVLTNE